jgi:hypothetical protein
MTTFFNINGVHHSVANAIRRELVQYIDGDMLEAIRVSGNTSMLDTEMIQHRVQLIPVSGQGMVSCVVKNTQAVEYMDVTTDMFTCIGHVKLWPGVFLVRLSPGEEIALTARAVRATLVAPAVTESPSYTQTRAVTFNGKEISYGDVAKEDRLLERMPELYSPQGLELGHFLRDYNLHGAVNDLLGYRALAVVDGDCFTIGVKPVAFGSAVDMYRGAVDRLLEMCIAVRALIHMGDRAFIGDSAVGLSGMVSWAYSSMYPTRTVAMVTRNERTEVTGDAAADADGLIAAVGRVEEVLKTLI